MLIALTLVVLLSPQNATALKDTLLYDGEPGSAPLLGGKWAVGTGGLILYDDGNGWVAASSPVTHTLRGLVAISDYQAWAVGNRGTLVHLDPATLTWQADPSPTTNDLTAITALSAGDLWAVGLGGTVLHYDGNGWATVNAGTTADLYGVTAVDRSHVWAVGANGTIQFYDGNTWTPQPSGVTQTLRSVHGRSPNNVWAVGDGGVILHWDGASWSPVASGLTTGDLYGVWAATDTGGTWAVGAGGVILYWDGTAWSQAASPTTETLYAVNGLRDNYIWAAGANGVLVYYDWDRVWRTVSSPTTAPLYGISGRAMPCMSYMAQVHGEGRGGGNALQLQPDPWHDSTYNLYCGDGGRRDFSSYDVLEFYFRSPEADPGNPAFWVTTWNHTSNVVNILDYIEGGIIDNTWRRVRIPLSVLATADWTLNNVEHLTWNKDAQRRTYFVDDIALRDTAPPQVLSLTPESNTILRLTFSEHYDPASVRDLTRYTLTSTTDPNYAGGVHPLDTGMHFRFQHFVGDTHQGPAARYDLFLRFPTPLTNGHTYTLHVQGIADLSGNTMPRAQLTFSYDDRTQLNLNIKVNQIGYLPDRPKMGYVGGYLGDLGGGAWAVGAGGTIFAWDDQTGWQAMPSPVTTTLRAVTATREDNAWAVGDGGVILHWDGTTWSQTASPTTADLFAIAFGPTNIGWAVGAGGVSLRYAGGAWTAVSTPVTVTLRSVWAGAGDTAWAVGDGGTILSWTGTAWTAEPSPTTADLYAVNGPQVDYLWAVGSGGTVLQREYGHWKVIAGTPGTAATLRTLTFDLGGGLWIGGDSGLLWHKPDFGGTPFTAQDSGTTATLHGLARFHARQFWAVGAGGTLLSKTTAAWNASTLGGQDLFGLFALRYGPLRLPDPPPDVILQDAVTSTPVLTVPLTLRHANDELSGEDVYAFDFSALTTPGTYRAYVPGLGLSDPFTVSVNALDFAAYTTARGLYYQRCGTALTPPYADPRFARPIDHEYDPAGRRIDAAFHDSLPSTPLYNGEVPGQMIDAHGGWHDAGDYGKYLPTAAGALWRLFTAYDMAPDHFQDNAWNIPESGNGVPDLLDEARWEVDWIARIQASDGGVYHKVTAQTWFGGMPQEESSPRYVFEKTTHDTALAAALFASASRLWAPYDAALAADYLTRAEQAWAFLQAHPTATPAGGFHNPEGNHTGGYNDPEDVDNRLWAAAELYRTTGQATYRQYFEHWWQTHAHPWTGNEWQVFYKNAYWAYLNATWPDADPTIKDEIRTIVLSRADPLVQRTKANPYRNGARLDVPGWIGWGAFSQSTGSSFALLLAWAVSGNETYREAAYVNLDTQLGANPLAMSFITGLGARYPHDPLHKPSVYDHVAEPVPGIPVFGVFAHLPNSQPHYWTAQSDEYNYPPTYDLLDPYPILRRYADAHQLVPMSEFTVLEMATAAVSFGLLRPAQRAAPQCVGDANGNGLGDVVDILATATTPGCLPYLSQSVIQWRRPWP